MREYNKHPVFDTATMRHVWEEYWADPGNNLYRRDTKGIFWPVEIKSSLVDDIKRFFVPKKNKNYRLGNV